MLFRSPTTWWKYATGRLRLNNILDAFGILILLEQKKSKEKEVGDDVRLES